MSETKPCPYCAETIDASATRCPFCDSTFDPNQKTRDKRAARKAEAIASGGIPDPSSLPGPLSPSSWTALVIVLVLAVPGVLVEILSSGRDSKGCMAVSLVFAGFAAIFAVASILQDLLGPSPRRRGTPVAAVKAFYGSIKRHHYARAWACLSPLDRTAESRFTQKLASLSVDQRNFSFDKAKPFGKYWRAQAGLDDRGMGGFHKSLKYEVLGSQEIRPGVAVVRVRLKVGGYPSWIVITVLLGVLIAVILMFALRKEESFELQKIVYRQGDTWWVAGGEFGDDEDALLEQRLLSGK